MKRKIYCTNVHLRIIEILITSVYNWVLSLLPLHSPSENIHQYVRLGQVK